MRFFSYLIKEKLNNSFYVKVLSCILVFSLLLVTLMFFLTYGTVHNNALEQSYAMEQTAISNISYSASEMQDVAHSMLNQIRNDPQLTRLIYSSTPDNLDNIHSMYLLQNYAEASSWIDSAYIYNAQEEIVIFTYEDETDFALTFSPLQDFYDREMLIQLCDVNTSFDLPLLRSITRNNEIGEKQLFTYYIPVRNSTTKCDGCFVVNINPERLLELSYGFTGDQERQIIIADSTSNFYTSSESFLQPNDQQAIIDYVFSSEEIQGQYNYEESGVLCVWSKAYDSSLYFISCVPSSRITEYPNTLRQWFVLFYVIVIIFSLIITFLMAQAIYKDYNKLHNRYAKEAKRYEDNYNYIKNALLRNFFSLGSANFVIGTQFEDNNIEIEDYNGYSLTLIKIKQYAEISPNSDMQSPHVRFTIYDSIKKYVPQALRFETVDMLQGYYLLITENIEYSTLQAALIPFSEAFSKENACTISGVTAESIDKLDELPVVYRKLSQSMDQLFFCSERFMPYTQLSAHHFYGKEQVSNVCESLVTALTAQEFEQGAALLSDFFDKWYEDYSDVYNTTDLLVSCLAAFLLNFRRAYAVTLDFDSVRFKNEIYRCESATAIKILFLNLMQDISSAYESVSNRSNYIDELLDLMEQNYHDPKLNIDGLADMVGLSVSHMQTIFKTATGHSISSHLRNLRLQQAARLLTETDLSAGEIATKTGFGNTNYFYTVFKKHYSITPNEYRIQNKQK